MWLRVMVGGVLALGALACAPVDPDRVSARLRLPSAPDCRPEGLASIRVTALGDFPTLDSEVEVLSTVGGSRELSHFPSTTLALSARASAARWEGLGVADVESLRLSPELLVLPLGVSCAIADPEARLPLGAAVAIVSDASVLVAGGLDERGLGTRRLAILSVHAERVALPSPTLLNPVAFASATRTPDGSEVLVAGGASSEGGEVRDTWELVSLTDGPRRFGTLRSRRRDHGALAVEDGRLRGVLLVGGSDGDAVLDTIEWVDPTSGASRTLGARLSTPRVRPRLLMRSPTSVLIFGGAGPTGVRASGVDVLDLVTEVVTAGPSVPGVPDWAVGLPDGRLAIASGGRVQLVLRDGAVVDSGARPDVVSPVAVSLGSSRVIVAGRDPRGERSAVLFDPGTGVSMQVDVSPIPTLLVALPDGTTLAFDEHSTSVRRDDRTTTFDSPRPTYLFATDQGELALDAPGHWRVSDDALISNSARARIDIPVLAFRDLRAELEASGSVSVGLVDTQGEPVAEVELDETSASLGACSIARTTPRAVSIVRRGTRVELVADGASRVCEVPGLTERVGIAVFAETGSALRSLALARLP